MSAGPGPLSQADVDAIEDRLPDVDDRIDVDEELPSHIERTAT